MNAHPTHLRLVEILLPEALRRAGCPLARGEIKTTRVSARLDYSAVQPPSTLIVVPVTWSAEALQR